MSINLYKELAKEKANLEKEEDLKQNKKRVTAEL